MKCWGDGSTGVLGRGDTETIGDDETPASIPPIDLGPVPAVDVVVGGGHACALLEDGHVKCWGDNKYGELGYGHTEPLGDDETPATYGPVEVF